MLNQTDEQRDRLADIIDGLVFADDLGSLERFMSFVNVAIAAAVIVFSSRILATPPPWLQGFALVLPAPCWSIGLTIGSGFTWWGRVHKDLCMRRNGTVIALIVSGGLLGPLFIKAPGLAALVALLQVLQVILGVRLHRKCKEATAGDS